jgi:hypothetical protein
MTAEHSREDQRARLARPLLDNPAARAAASGAVERLVAGLQDGLDRADADAYDRQFASDVLWGSPYGATLHGYAALNAVHRSLMTAGAAPPCLPGSSRRTVPRCSPENDVADHGSVEIDHEKAGAPLGRPRDLALKLVTRPGAAEVGAHLRRGQQLDERRTVPGLGLTEHEPLGPDRGRRPGDGSELSHGGQSTARPPGRSLRRPTQNRHLPAAWA